ncbi:MAG: ethylbenzene dehydrogenase-related protein [Burkholderiaceae bacterium]
MSAPSPRLKKLDATTVVLHWALVITLLFSLATGLRISADAEESVWAAALNFILLQGNVMHWHIWAAYSLAIVAAAYVAFLVRAKLKARVAMTRARVAGLAVPNKKTRWQSINVIVYWVAFALLFIAALTGTALYFFPGLISHAWIILIHRVVAWLLIAYVGLHVLAQFAMGGYRQLLKVVNPRAAYGPAAAVAMLLAVVVGSAVYALDTVAVRELRVVATQTPPQIDGNPADATWLEAPQQVITTTRGGNQPGGGVDVGVRMMHDGERLYALYEWPDTTRSQKHLPLQKTANGWRVVQKEYGRQDEDDFYEDKFGVMLATTPEIAGAGTSHLGPKPLKDKPSPSGGRGLHYTTDGSNVDVWHWKSVRTGASGMNQIDDNYFGPPMEPKSDKKRYTGGYTKDPKTGGGFKMNWEKYTDGKVKPLRLPKDPDVLKRLGELNLDPAASDDGEFWLPIEDTVAYSESLDTYPVGTVMPSVLIEGPFEGDRGDVKAVSSWQDGWWRMEVTRLLDTGSKYDTPVRADKDTYMWVAVFDHSQTRHSLHLHPLRLVLEKPEKIQTQAAAN